MSLSLYHLRGLIQRARSWFIWKNVYCSVLFSGRKNLKTSSKSRRPDVWRRRLTHYRTQNISIEVSCAFLYVLPASCLTDYHTTAMVKAWQSCEGTSMLHLLQLSIAPCHYSGATCVSTSTRCACSLVHRFAGCFCIHASNVRGCIALGLLGICGNTARMWTIYRIANRWIQYRVTTWR